MIQGQKLTKRLCDAAQPGRREDGTTREAVVFDAGDGSVKGYGLRISPKGAKSFILMYRAGRGRAAPLRKVTIGPLGSPWTVETARAEARRILGEVASGRDPAGDRAERRAAAKGNAAAKDSVRAAVDEWIKRDQAKNRTVGEVRRLMDREVIPLWGERTLASIRKRDVISLVNGIADRGARTAANRALAHIRRLLQWCTSQDLIEANPAQTVEKPGTEVRRDRVLDDGELVEVWRALDGMAEPFVAGVRLLLLTGARRSEIFAAERAELNRNALALPAGRAKAKEGRNIHLSPPALAIVDGLTVWPACPYLLTMDGRHPFSGFGHAKAELDRHILAARQKEVGEEAKPMRPWRLHDLRRSVATGLQQRGARLEVIEAILGHVSGSRSGVVGVYQRHSFDAEARAALALWGEHLAGLLEPTSGTVASMRRAGAGP